MEESKMLEKVKESKKIMEVKIEQAEKMVIGAVEQFTAELEKLARESSEEELKAFLETDDEEIEFPEKMAAIHGYMQSHEPTKDIAVVILGMRK